MALREYLTTEVGEDWVDGLITRREAVRRLILLGMTASSATALLAACAAQISPSPAVSSPTAARSTPGAAATASGAAPSPASVTPGEAITFPGPTGELQGFLASAETPAGAMLVIHENRGLTDHIRSVAGRLAGDGYSALAIDLLSEEGGTAALGDPGNVPAALAAASTERLVADMPAGLTSSNGACPGAKIGDHRLLLRRRHGLDAARRR